MNLINLEAEGIEKRRIALIVKIRAPEAMQRHIENANRRAEYTHRLISNDICPRCGAKLVIRNGTHCRFTLPLSKDENFIIFLMTTKSRIEDMEARFDRVKEAAGQLEKAKEQFLGLSGDVALLKEYYSSGVWRKDFEADENGRLPKGLKRGVLSEDGLWNLLEETDYFFRIFTT